MTDYRNAFFVYQRKFVFSLLLFLCFYSPFAQQFNFSNYGVEDGLPQSTVFEIFQDNDGYLWLGTDGGGLCRYDGFRFKTFGKAEGLNANVIRKIAQDGKGNLWIASNSGLYYMNDGKFHSLDQIVNNRTIFFISVFVDSKQTVWAASTGNGIFKISLGADNKFIVKNYTVSDGLSNDYIFDVCEDGRGRIWVASFGEGMDVYDPFLGTFKNCKQNESSLNEVICMKKFDNDNFIIGTKNAGAYKMNTDNNEVVCKLIPGTEQSMVWSIVVDGDKNYWVATDRFGVVTSDESFKLTMNTGLLTNKIFKVFIDREKNTWVGTEDNGVTKYSGNTFTHITANELPGLSSVSSILKDKQNNYWVATSTSGIYQVSYSNNKIKLIKHFDSRSGLASNEITGLSCSNDNTLWIASANGVSSYNGTSFKNFSEADGITGSYVNCVFVDSKNRLWIGTRAGLSLLNEEGKFSSISESNGLINNEVQSFLEDKKHNIWIATLGGLVKYDGEKLFSYFEEDGLTEKKIHCLAEDKKGNIYIGTFGGGVFRFNTASQTKKVISQICADRAMVSNNIYSLSFQNDSILIVGTNQGLDKISFDKDFNIRSITHLGKSEGFKNLENGLNAILNDKNEIFWCGTPKGITLYCTLCDKLNLIKPTIKIASLNVNGIAYADKSNLHFSYTQNSLKVDFVSISLTNPSSNAYFAKLIGFDTVWNKLLIDKQNLNEFVSVEYKKLQPGKYKLLLKAKNNDGIESDVIVIDFSIAQPFYKTIWFIILAILFSFLVILLFFKYRERKLILEKQKLETIVTERTAEVVASKREIESQKDLLEIQKHEITDSINYSKRIQNAILPEQSLLYKNLPQSFILYRPKDIVSGDFYFFSEGKQNKFYLAVADCTGHGVPGAFMSMIGSKELNEAVKTNTEPRDILSTLNVGVRETLKQGNLEIGIKDGMDIGFLLFNRKEGIGSMKISYAGANRPLWIIRNGVPEVSEIKATKTAIGGYTQDDQVFAQHELVIEKGDTIYLFSDGYADQFGGETGKKMMTKRFKELLIENAHLSMEEQKTYLSEYFDAWKGSNNEQVDDVLVIGVRA